MLNKTLPFLFVIVVPVVPAVIVDVPEYDTPESNPSNDYAELATESNSIDIPEP